MLRELPPSHTVRKNKVIGKLGTRREGDRTDSTVVGCVRVRRDGRRGCYSATTIANVLIEGHMVDEGMATTGPALNWTISVGVNPMDCIFQVVVEL